ncbi:hypothetical protein SAMN05216206_1841 [Pseudomonas guineae]|uniref:Uncharacterized protein n=1 Tax=Pseudomonas guineae TaxID=425504 RepID=A0A1I3H6I0_9PSED|nr:hypothetical protein SAMN05216206_1841 [Pseudomonas guineae]
MVFLCGLNTKHLFSSLAIDIVDIKKLLTI